MHDPRQCTLRGPISEQFLHPPQDRFVRRRTRTRVPTITRQALSRTPHVAMHAKPCTSVVSSLQLQAPIQRNGQQQMGETLHCDKKVCQILGSAGGAVALTPLSLVSLHLAPPDIFLCVELAPQTLGSLPLVTFHHLLALSI